MKRSTSYGIGLMLALVGGTGWAQPEGNMPNPPATADWNPTWLFLKALLFLILIIGLIFVLVYLLKKYWSRGLGFSGDNQWFQVLARVPVYANQSVALVRIFDRVFLFGIGENMITNLMEVPDSPQLQQWLDRQNRKPQPLNGGNFFSLLRKKVKA